MVDGIDGDDEKEEGLPELLGEVDPVRVLEVNGGGAAVEEDDCDPEKLSNTTKAGVLIAPLCHPTVKKTVEPLTSCAAVTPSTPLGRGLGPLRLTA